MSNDVTYFNQDDGEPPYEPVRKKRGCMFYGCLSAVIVSILAAVLLGIFFFILVRWFGKFVEEFGEDAPQAIQVAELPADELKALRDRVDDFEEKLVADKPVEPIVLTAKQINAMIDAEPELKGIIAIDFVGDKVKGEVAFPLEKMGFPGKFINGKATFDVRVENGLLLWTFDTLEVKGKPVGEDVMAQLRLQNLAKDMNAKPENAQILGKIESVEIKDGKLIIIPKLRPESAEKKKDEPKKVEPKDEPKTRTKPAQDAA